MSKQPSGRFVIRLRPSVHESLRKEAKRRQLSLNVYCQQALEASLVNNVLSGGIEPAKAPLVTAISDLVGDALEGVVLFGSMARGESRASSDRDLLVIVRRSLPLTRGLYTRWDESSFPGEVSPHFVHVPLQAMDAGSLWLEAAVDGIVIYEVNEEVSRFFGSVRRLIASGRLKQLSAHGHHYWVKNGEEDSRVQ
jgi:predicted nucleotidyltransferase